MRSPLCECGDEKAMHTILPGQTFCRVRGCYCEAFVLRSTPPPVKDCPHCGGKGHRSEIDKADGGTVYTVCTECGGTGRLHANGESLVRELSLS